MKENSMPTNQPPGFNSAKQRAESLASDTSKVSSLLTDAVFKAGKNKRALKKVWEDLSTLFRLIRAWVSGSYRNIPWPSIVLAIAAVIYFVNPLDLITDFIPLIGYLDDTTVVWFVMASISNELAKFREWEQTQS